MPFSLFDSIPEARIPSRWQVGGSKSRRRLVCKEECYRFAAISLRIIRKHGITISKLPLITASMFVSDRLSAVSHVLTVHERSSPRSRPFIHVAHSLRHRPLIISMQSRTGSWSNTLVFGIWSNEHLIITRYLLLQSLPTLLISPTRS